MDNSEHNIKHIDNKADFDRIAMDFFGKFSPFHKVLKERCELLLKITENIINSTEHDLLLGASIKEFFSLIEVDLFYINIISPYENYNDKDDFLTKIKSTFKQFSKTFNKIENRKLYFDSSFQSIYELKGIRDNLIHPKELEHTIIPKKFDILTLKKIFQVYNTFINNLMENIFIQRTISIKELFYTGNK